MHNHVFIPLLIASFVASGCSFKESEALQTAKCYKSGIVLEDGLLKAAAESKLSSLAMEGALSTRQSMELHEEVNNQLGHQDPARYVGLLHEWQGGQFCQSLVQDLKREIDREVQALLKPALGSEESSCQMFSKQLEASRAPGHEQYAADLRKVLSESLRATAKDQLKPYQFDVLFAPDFKGFSLLVSEVDQQCKQGALSLAAALKALPDLQRIPSPTTRQLVEEQSRVTTNNSCGEHRDYFCEATLRQRAVELAVQESKQCDAAPIDSSQDCDGTAEELMEGHLNQLKIAALERHRDKALEALQDSKRRLSEIDLNRPGFLRHF